MALAKTTKQKVIGELRPGHKSAAVEVPFDPEEKWAIKPRALWPGRRGYTVRGELNGVSFGSCIVARSRKFWMLVDEDVQEKAGVSVGDTVRFSVEPMSAREVGLAKARKKNPALNKRGVTFDTVRELALALPGVDEGTSYGTPAFRVGGRILARFHQDGESLVLKVEYAAREVLTGSNPESFYVTDHYRCYPLMLVRLERVELGLLHGLIEEAWRSLASKRAIAEYEASRD